MGFATCIRYSENYGEEQNKDSKVYLRVIFKTWTKRYGKIIESYTRCYKKTLNLNIFELIVKSKKVFGAS